MLKFSHKTTHELAYVSNSTWISFIYSFIFFLFVFLIFCSVDARASLLLQLSTPMYEYDRKLLVYNQMHTAI